MKILGCEIRAYCRLLFAALASCHLVLACIVVLFLLSGCSGADDDVLSRCGELRLRLERLREERLQAAREASQEDRWMRAKDGDPVRSRGSAVELLKEIADNRRQLEELQSGLSDESGSDHEKNRAENQSILENLDALNVFRFIEGIDDEATFLSTDETQHDRMALSSLKHVIYIVCVILVAADSWVFASVCIHVGVA
jgi:hypothetical protein